MLIAAQTALLQQLRDRQQSIEQAHFDSAIKQLGRPIHPDDFYTLRPDKLFQIASHSDDTTDRRSRPASALSLGARLDPRGSDYYARMFFLKFLFHLMKNKILLESNHALELISIPLDVEFSRKLLRQALDRTYYSSRAILECRKMLAFYTHKQEQFLAKDFLIFAPIAEGIQEQSPRKKDHPSTLHYRPMTAGEPMDFSPLTNDNCVDTILSTNIKREAVIEAYQSLSSNDNS